MMSALHISASVHIGDSTRVYTIIAIDGDQVWLRDAEGNHSTREVGEVRMAAYGNGHPQDNAPPSLDQVMAWPGFWHGNPPRAKEGSL
jgi:hypothetical protein